MKICSKCVNCEIQEFTDKDDVLYCHEADMVVTENEFIARDCMCYEENKCDI